MDGRRVKVVSKFQLHKCDQTYHRSIMKSISHISRVPDDILVGIMSSLTMKEFARISVVSSHWKKLWTHTLCLNFEAKDRIKFRRKMRALRMERRKYIKWVDSVLRSHDGPNLEEFRICFDLDKSAKKAIKRWLIFAFARHVQRLELNFSDNSGRLHRMYEFPNLKACLLSLKSLKSLCLKGVKVGGDDIGFFLRECPLLEELIVHGSFDFRELEVCGSSLALKHLEICCSTPFPAPFKVSAPNLTKLKVMTLQGVLLENVPKLVELDLIHAFDDIFVKKSVPALAHCVSQLEVLTLHLATSQAIVELCDFPQLPKLKKLSIISLAFRDDRLIGLTSFIRASLHLQEFEVKLHWVENTRRERRGKKAIMHSPHEHLKVVKFLGYYGRSSDLEILRYILANCVALEKLIIDPSDQPLDDRRKEFTGAEICRARYARRQVRKARMPDHIHLLIL